MGTRRSFIEKTVRGVALCLAFTVESGKLALSPAQAREKRVPLQRLNAMQANTLELLGETLLPGSAALGLIHFIDHQLGADPNDSLLIAKYFDVVPPFYDFYAAGVRAADALARQHFDKRVGELDQAQRQVCVRAMSVPHSAVNGFPLFLFYLCLRSDAVDVVYGTPEGFAQLDVPYMPHIVPPSIWRS